MQDGSVHDYLFDQASCDWVHWMKTVPQQELPPTLAFNEIIVQTIDTVRYSHLMRLLITHGHHTLFTGQLLTNNFAATLVSRLQADVLLYVICCAVLSYNNSITYLQANSKHDSTTCS